ncbi:unnamed protein product [Symbiodinium necroappetens]|uniref:IBB domain-containing protein n=1 Tax=Symbiodinium necroappetens TaxID=1628268 RepID=A0A813BSY4_9DINO|nr:unnamed protein product [Symbiodinium necroappetens]
MSGFGERLSQRQKAFKKGVDADDARRKREDAAVQLRKQTRDEALMKKRMVNDIPAAGQTTDPMALAQMGERMATVPSNCAVEQIPALSQALLSDDPQAQFNATQQFRKLLSIEQNPPISEVINAGVVPRFVQFLKEINRPDLQFEAAWVLTNIASGNADQTRVVVEQGALPIFVQLLQGPLSFLQPPLEQERQALQNTALSWLDVATETEHSEIDFGHRSNLAAMALSNEEVWMLQRLSACLHEADMQLMQDLAELHRRHLQELRVLYDQKIQSLLDQGWTLQAKGLAAVASRHLRHRQQVQDQQRQQQQLLCVQRAKFREAQTRRAGPGPGATSAPQGSTLPAWQGGQAGPALPVLRLCSGEVRCPPGCIGKTPPEDPILGRSPNDDVREQAVWALGNIAGDSPNFRDLVLQSGGLHPVMTVLRESEKTSMMRNATWTLSNLCRGKPPPPFEWVSPALGTLANLIYSCDCEVLTDACWALSYLSDGPNERITAVIQAGVCRRLVELLLHTSPLVQTPALRAVGNIVTGDDNQTQVILQSGALPSLLKLLSHAKKAIRKESCWTISNITAGNREQIQEVINNGLLPPVIHLLQTADFDIKKEAAWAISNATSGGSPQQVEYLVEMQCIKPLVDLLVVSDAKIIGVALEALENILKVGKDKQQKLGMAENPFAAKIEQADGLPKIENLQEDPNEEVYQKAMKILEKYFPLEDEDAEIGEDVSNPQQFQFGAQVPTGGFSFGS